MTQINSKNVQNMVTHWIKTPVNAYFGLDYGQDLKSLLQTPQITSEADEQISKLKEDVPILNAYPNGTVNIYGQYAAPDKLSLFIEVADTVYTV